MNYRIIATLGPATDDPRVLDDVIRAGVDVVRVNLSHDSHERHRQRAETVRNDYAALVEAHRAALSDLCRANGWSFTVNRTDHPAEMTLLALHMLMSETERA